MSHIFTIGQAIQRAIKITVNGKLARAVRADERVFLVTNTAIYHFDAHSEAGLVLGEGLFKDVDGNNVKVAFVEEVPLSNNTWPIVR